MYFVFLLIVIWQVFAMGNMYLTDGQKIVEEGFLAGYTSSTYAVVALIALGGLLVPCVIQQFDNLIKVLLSKSLLSSSPLHTPLSYMVRRLGLSIYSSASLTYSHIHYHLYVLL